MSDNTKKISVHRMTDEEAAAVRAKMPAALRHLTDPGPKIVTVVDRTAGTDDAEPVDLGALTDPRCHDGAMDSDTAYVVRIVCRYLDAGAQVPELAGDAIDVIGRPLSPRHLRTLLDRLEQLEPLSDPPRRRLMPWIVTARRLPGWRDERLRAERRVTVARRPPLTQCTVGDEIYVYHHGDLPAAPRRAPPPCP